MRLDKVINVWLGMWMFLASLRTELDRGGFAA
jgi:hypothetical protein